MPGVEKRHGPGPGGGAMYVGAFMYPRGEGGGCCQWDGGGGGCSIWGGGGCKYFQQEHPRTLRVLWNYANPKLGAERNSCVQSQQLTTRLRASLLFSSSCLLPHSQCSPRFIPSILQLSAAPQSLQPPLPQHFTRLPKGVGYQELGLLWVPPKQMLLRGAAEAEVAAFGAEAKTREKRGPGPQPSPVVRRMTFSRRSRDPFQRGGSIANVLRNLFP
jgi:hypothetical protein